MNRPQLDSTRHQLRTILFWVLMLQQREELAQKEFDKTWRFVTQLFFLKHVRSIWIPPFHEGWDNILSHPTDLADATTIIFALCSFTEDNLMLRPHRGTCCPVWNPNFLIFNLDKCPELVEIAVFERLLSILCLYCYGISFQLIHSFIFRKSPKEYGLEEPWEGTPKFDTPTLLVDDLANSTMSLKICSDICRNYEIQKLNYAFVIVNKVNRNYYDMGLPEEQYSKSEHELRQKHDMYLDPNTTIISLFDMDEFNLKGASHWNTWNYTTTSMFFLCSKK